MVDGRDGRSVGLRGVVALLEWEGVRGVNVNIEPKANVCATHGLVSNETWRSLDRLPDTAHKLDRACRVLVRSLIQKDAMHGKRAGIGGPPRVHVDVVDHVHDISSGVIGPHIPQNLSVGIRSQLRHRRRVLGVGQRPIARSAVGVHNHCELQLGTPLQPLQYKTSA